MGNIWKKIKTYNKKYDVRLQISIKRIIEKMFRNPDFEKLVYREMIDYDRNRIIIEFKHGLKDEELQALNVVQEDESEVFRDGPEQ